VVSGLALSLVTPWGLGRQWWLVVKVVLGLVVIVSAVGLTNGWVERASATAAERGGATAWLVVAGSAGHLVVLAAATPTWVDEPWGATRRRLRTGTTGE
jgi:hypothetical protein